MPAPISASIAQLARLAREGSLDLRQLALRVKADLLLSTTQPPEADLDAFAEMAQTLIPLVDEATAVALARKLAAWPHAPQRVLAALRGRGGAVLAALLRHGVPATPAEIEAFAASGSAEVLKACAIRHDLGEAAVRMLLGHGLRSVDLALLSNLAAPLPHDCADILVPRAAQDSDLAVALLARADIPAARLAPLFAQASAERRNAMLDALAAHDAVSPGERVAPLPADVMAGWIETAGVDREGAYGAVATRLGGGQSLAEALARDEDRELTALALIGAGASPEDATRFLIRLGDEAAHSVERIFGLAALMRRVRPSVARRLVLLVAGVRQRATAPAGEHQPVMDPSGTPARWSARGTLEKTGLLRPRATQRR